MNTTALKAASQHGGPIVLGGGMMLLAIAVAVPGHFRPEAAAPRPTVTVTQTPVPIAAPSHGHETAKPGTSTIPEPVTVVAASDRQAALPHTAGGGASHTQARPPTAPQPTPRPSGGSSAAASVSLRHPLGVLPSVGVDLTVGGHR